jgi:hypothetical protein
VIIQAHEEIVSFAICLLRCHYPFWYIDYLIIDLISSMHVSDFSAVEKFVEDILIDLMDEKVMSTGTQASSMRGVQASPSMDRGS